MDIPSASSRSEPYASRGQKDFKPAANDPYLMCKHQPYSLHLVHKSTAVCIVNENLKVQVNE